MCFWQISKANMPPVEDWAFQHFPCFSWGSLHRRDTFHKSCIGNKPHMIPRWFRGVGSLPSYSWASDPHAAHQAWVPRDAGHFLPSVISAAPSLLQSYHRKNTRLFVVYTYSYLLALSELAPWDLHNACIWSQRRIPRWCEAVFLSLAHSLDIIAAHAASRQLANHFIIFSTAGFHRRYRLHPSPWYSLIFIYAF